MQYIGVIDCNNFFVSCERLFRPDLIGKPVLVLSSNDGCVVARSQEVKDIGIMMGVPYFQIKDIIKKARITVFSSHFALYRDISTRVFQAVRTELPNKQQYSIDEAFFSIEAPSPEAAERMLWQVKRVVERKVGIPVSIGLAVTKTQAKYASRLAKKAGGVMVLTPADWMIRTSEIPLSDIWGVGRQMVVRYRKVNLLSVQDLLGAPRPHIEALFGIAGLRLQAELAGQMVYPVEKNSSVKKSITSSRSFKNSTNSLAVLKDAVAYHLRHATSELRAMGHVTASVTVSIWPSHHGDFVLRGGSRQLLLSAPTADTTVLLKAVMPLVEELFESEVPYKKAGVLLGQFTKADMVQTSLFEMSTPAPKSTELMQTLDVLNAKFGRDMVRVGRHTASETWSSGHAELSPAYTTNWTMLPIVKGG
jgi:DNA polymerase V